MSRRLAELLGNHREKYDWIEAVLLLGQAGDGFVSGSALTSGAHSLSADVAERVMMALAAEGALRMKGKARVGYLQDKYVVTSPDRLREVLRISLYLATVDGEQDRQPASEAFELIATVPEELDDASSANFAPLAPSLQRLVVSASKSVMVLIPFFDQDGLDPIADALLARAGLGIPVTLIVREVGEEDSVNRRVISRFLKRVRESGLQGMVRVYEFDHRRANGTRVTFHAKAVIVDRRRAYLGSANFTTNGMGRFLEIGVIVEGEKVAALADLVDAVLAPGVARRVWPPGTSGGYV